MDPVVIAFGFGVGILIGLTGIGGGSLMTPLLVIVVGIKPVVAIGTDLAYGAITKTLGGWRHLRKGTVDLRLTWWLAAGAVPGSLIGVWIVNKLHHEYGAGFDDTLLGMVGAALLVVSAATLARALFMPKLVAQERHTADLTEPMKLGAVVIGFVLGVILGVTSVGSGALIGLALILVYRLTPHRVVGTDVFLAAMLLWVAGLAHWFSGNVDLTLMVNILIGSIPGVWLGTSLIDKVPAAGLRPALGCVLLGSGLGVLTKAGLDVPVAAIVGAPLAVGIFAWVIQRSRVTPAPGPAARPVVVATPEHP